MTTFFQQIFSDGVALALLVLGLLITIGILIRALWMALRKDEQLKYEFVTIIAHKFRTPLTHIKWVSDSLISSEQDSFKKQSLGDIRVSNEKLIKLMNMLIETIDSDKASSSLYTFEDLSLCDVVQSVAGAFKDEFHQKNIFFSVKCVTEDTRVRADRQRLEFVIQAVLENAALYSTPGMDVSVETGNDGARAWVAVTDHGIGMDQLTLSRMFTKFFRAPNAARMDTEGFGVSLYLARSVMRRHGGAIEAFSEGLGTGSSFVISMPALPRTP